MVGDRSRVWQCVYSIVLILLAGLTSMAQSDSHGPEVRVFLDFLRHEEAELEFQIAHGEISLREYRRSKSRIAIHRQTVLDLVRERGEDEVPEIYVKAADEVSQIINGGLAGLKNTRPGEIVDRRFRFVGTVSRGEVFYVFERLVGS